MLTDCASLMLQLSFIEVSGGALRRTARRGQAELSVRDVCVHSHKTYTYT